jgi:hypothetical protein
MHMHSEGLGIASIIMGGILVIKNFLGGSLVIKVFLGGSLVICRIINVN